MVPNKFHYAIVGQTASEIINSKANSEKENKGLTTWKNSPEGGIGEIFHLPPLKVQQEIVRILDNFTELTAIQQEMLI